MKDFSRWILPFERVSLRDIPIVGGKNASLGEMTQALCSQGIAVPPGFAVTADAFSELMGEGLAHRIYSALEMLDVSDLQALSHTGREIREAIQSHGLPKNVNDAILKAYAELCDRCGVESLPVAVRSSATAEDLPEASFAGQQETFLNVRGGAQLLDACLSCFASLFTDRAISYRATRGYSHQQVRLSIGVQRMVRSDLGSAGVIFTLDTETGARNVILLNSAWGLGENVVGGRVDPDEFLLSKPLLGQALQPILRRRLGSKRMRMIYDSHGTRRTRNVEVSPLDQARFSLDDSDVIQLGLWARQIESHYTRLHGRDTPMDIEWAKDGETGELFVLQARPETVHARRSPQEMEIMVLQRRSQVLLRGRAVGSKIGAGPARVVRSASGLPLFRSGEVLVADMTDPDWEPLMKKASGIITNRGGRTCHAAIVSREHGVPCVVGTGEATRLLREGQEVTVSCAEGEEGRIYEGHLPFVTERRSWNAAERTRTKILVNLGNPDQALRTSLLPVDGVGLARIEFIIAEHVGIHPMALLHPERIPDRAVRRSILDRIQGYESDPGAYFVDRLAEGIGMIAGAFHPRPVVVRLSDFKTNEYAHLLGGEAFEPHEENPMIGLRGASRYYDPRYRDGFALECRALHRVRKEMGLKGVEILVPFCRSPEEGRKVLEVMRESGLVQGQDGLKVLVMSEIPVNVLRAAEFSRVFDGFSIGSNDLTQMTLAVDRDSEILSHLFDERDPSVMQLLEWAIQEAHRAGKPIGICGQAPSDYPEVARFLVEKGIDSISLNPDSVLQAREIILAEEKRLSSLPAPGMTRSPVPSEIGRSSSIL